MADVSSKNMYALLGNDPEEDSDREPEPPTKAMDKPVARSGKRDAAETAAPARATAGESRGGRGGAGRGRGRGGSDGAFQDREAGRDANRSHQDYVNQTDRPYRGRGGDRGGRGRGGRGRDFRDGRDDRRSHGRPNEHVKQADQSWGAPTGDAELADEQAGDAIAQDEVKEGGIDATVDAPVNADGEKLEENAEPAEPEIQTKSYDEYMAELAEKKLALGSTLQVRKANEGSKQDKKFDDAKALSKDDEEDSYIKGREAKAGRARERKEKQTLDIDHRFQESTRGDRGGGDRGGRGRGRGEFRGSDRGDRGGRGDFRGSDRGDRGGRGGRGRGEGRGEYRGRGGEGRGRGGGEGRGRGGNSNVNTSDESAFPKLGA